MRRRRGDHSSPPIPEVEEEGDKEDDVESPLSVGRRIPIRRKYNAGNDIKVDIPGFDGRLDVDTFVDWLRPVERVFEYNEVSENKIVKIVGLKLKMYASPWLENICERRARSGKTKVRDWTKMKKLLKEKILTNYYVQETFATFHKLKQGSRTVEEYSSEFASLMMKCNVVENEPQTLFVFLVDWTIELLMWLNCNATTLWRSSFY